MVAVGVAILILGGLSYGITPLLGFILAVIFIGSAGVFALSSKVFKVRAAASLVDSLRLRGDEAVLDVGCGRGLMLITAAKHLQTGRAVGVDIWNRRLQSSNSPENTLENARRAAVAEKVEVRFGDARQLPFEDGTFDVVLSSLVLHHIPRGERRDALGEMVRVLKPGGRIAMIDLFHSAEILRELTDLGMTKMVVSPSKLSLLGAGTLTALKPISAA
jgi:ubiquinone/menaquinone biosynthesis C-methylase UbiE